MKKRLVDPQKIYGEGWDLLEEGNFEQALEIGKRLERLRWTGAFELQAAVYEAQDDRESAVDILKRGIDKVGGPYLLFSRLGNTLSDLGRYDEAIQTYKDGLALDTTDIALFRMNIGLVYSRTDQNEKALSEYQSIEKEIADRGESEPIYWHYMAMLARVLSDLKYHSDLAKLINPIRKKLLDEDCFELSKSRIAAAYAVSLFHKNEDAASIRWLGRAIELDRNGWQPKWLSRENILKKLSSGGILYYITCEGIWPAHLTGSGEDCGVLACFEVVAEDENQAFEFAKSFISKEVRNSFVLGEAEIIEKQTLDPKGVYDVQSYIFYDLNGDEDEE